MLTGCKGYLGSFKLDLGSETGDASEEPLCEADTQHLLQEEFIEAFYKDADFCAQVLECILSGTGEECTVQVRKPQRMWFKRPPVEELQRWKVSCTRPKFLSMGLVIEPPLVTDKVGVSTMESCSSYNTVADLLPNVSSGNGKHEFQGSKLKIGREPEATTLFNCAVAKGSLGLQALCAPDAVIGTKAPEGKSLNQVGHHQLLTSLQSEMKDSTGPSLGRQSNQKWNANPLYVFSTSDSDSNESGQHNASCGRWMDGMENGRTLNEVEIRHKTQHQQEASQSPATSFQTLKPSKGGLLAQHLNGANPNDYLSVSDENLGKEVSSLASISAYTRGKNKDLNARSISQGLSFMQICESNLDKPSSTQSISKSASRKRWQEACNISRAELHTVKAEVQDCKMRPATLLWKAGSLGTEELPPVDRGHLRDLPPAAVAYDNQTGSQVTSQTRVENEMRPPLHIWSSSLIGGEHEIDKINPSCLHGEVLQSREESPSLTGTFKTTDESRQGVMGKPPLESACRAITRGVFKPPRMDWAPPPTKKIPYKGPQPHTPTTSSGVDNMHSTKSGVTWTVPWDTHQSAATKSNIVKKSSSGM